MRSLPVIAIALLLGAVVSFFVARALGPGGEPIQSARVVVANEAVDPGSRLSALQLRIADWPLLSRPPGGFASIDAVAGRVVRAPLQPGEPVTETRLAAVDARGGLASIITPGKRAVSVRVNDVVGVAGFALPGSFVDVMVSARDASDKPFSRTVLERVKVLAAAQDTWVDPAKPKLVNAVTLELSPDEAERLDLARTVGALSLGLRNELDQSASAVDARSAGARLADLVASAAPPPGPRPLSAAPRRAAVATPDTVPVASAPLPKAAPVVFEEIRGTRRTLVSEEAE